MFYNIFSIRPIQVGIAFFVLVVGGSLLYSWYASETTKAELAETLPMRQHAEPLTAEWTAPVDVATPGDVITPSENTEWPEPISEETQSALEVAEFRDIADFLLPEDVVSEHAPAEDVPVSPFGFGPYPEVPAGYPLPQSIPWEWSEENIAASKKTMEKILQEQGVSFTEFLKTNELMARVGIKLWNEGRHFDGITTSNQTGLFYPNEPDVLYVKWREAIRSNGGVRRYMSKTIGSAISNVSIAAQQGGEPPPDWIEIRSFNEGVDPYEYLGLNR
jgi:hypothetical protein